VQPAGGYPVFLSAKSDAAGRVALRTAPGHYRATVVSAGHLHAEVAFELAAGTTEQNIALEPPSWINVRVEGARPGHTYTVRAVVLDGPDSGFPLRLVDGDRPVSDVPAEAGVDGTATHRIKARAGRYRLRLEAREGFALTGTVIAAREVDLELPDSGEVRLTLPAASQ